MIETLRELEPFSAYTQSRKREIEAALERALPAPPACPPLVAEAMRYGVIGNGKRMRPLLTLAVAEAVARSSDASPAKVAEAVDLAMPSACAIEFIHCYSLVHDDLPAMDNDRLRRGRPTLHVCYGEAMAILAGDGLFAEAFALLANEPNDSGRPHIAERKLRVLKRVSQALGAAGMLGGQAMDLALVDRMAPANAAAAGDVEGYTLNEMHARKTGSLMRAAACAGAIMAGGTAAQIEAGDRFAAEIGMAFQIVDDILDCESTSDVLGKTAGKDRAAGKPTYPAVFGIERSRRMAAGCLERAQQVLYGSGLWGDRLLSLGRLAIDRAS
jgi:geranylgeranyl pyrophosphate synthase